MSRTVTALYDSRTEAETARERLSSVSDIQNVRIIDQQEGGAASSESGEHRSWFEKLFMPEDDHQTFSEGMRRGGYMLCAKIDNEQDADRIIQVLEETSPVDLDERSQSWRSEGWQPEQRSSAFGATSQSGFESNESGQRTIEEERIPIVDEELHVGKREVERGGARVRSYVRETPVSEQVTLHDENVSIERRPVNETLSQSELGSGDLLRDREIEMRATGEEAVIGKEAHVNEEVVVRKTANEHTENVSDTVRHTEVDVEGDTDTGRGAFGFDKESSTGGTSNESSRSEFEKDDYNRR